MRSDFFFHQTKRNETEGNGTEPKQTKRNRSKRNGTEGNETNPSETEGNETVPNQKTTTKRNRKRQALSFINSTVRKMFHRLPLAELELYPTPRQYFVF